jgi:DNA-binding GntR family transcriptional regulator
VTTDSAATDLPQLDRTNLRQQARVAIQAQIVTGGIEAGRIYPVAFFASQLGVSATPVREALFDLAHDGLVELVRNRGFRILGLSDHDLDEIMELRLMLEVPAIRSCAGRLSPEGLETCARLMRETEEYAASGDLANFFSSDRDFHLGLLEPLENRRQFDMIRRLREQARGLRLLAESNYLLAAADEHHQLLDAMASGEGERAEALMRAHLQHTRGIWIGRDDPDLARRT